MNALKSKIRELLLSNNEVNWFIIHDISLCSPPENMSYSFIDKTIRNGEPFRKNQGYINLESDLMIEDFKKLIIELIDCFGENQLALSNLYIISCEASYRGDRDELVDVFKKNIEEDKRKEIFNILLNSLNSEYYMHNQISRELPTDASNWLQLFRKTQGICPVNDPVINCLRLCRENMDSNLNFELIENMKPLLRSVVLNKGFNLIISDEKMEHLFEKKEEIIFLAAYLMDNEYKKKPNWLSEEFIELMMEKYWKDVGKNIFLEIYGQEHKEEMDGLLEKLIHENFTKKISAGGKKDNEWINSFEFPDDYIALFSWVNSKEIEIVNNNIFIIFLNQFIEELQRIEKTIPDQLVNEKNSFKPYRLYEEKYQISLAYLLLLLINNFDDKIQTSLKDIFYKFVPLFYGNCHARSLAMGFTEIMILIGLSSCKLKKDFDEKEVVALKKYLTIIENTILVPYVHLSERENRIWDCENEADMWKYDAGGYLVSKYLSEIQSQELSHYEEFYKAISQIKIAEWPYERIQRL